MINRANTGSDYPENAASPVVKKAKLMQIPASYEQCSSEVQKPKIMVGIPAFNEERSISTIVTSARKYADEVVVVDDGSIDRTAELARIAGAIVVRHRINRGAGAATATCFEQARIRQADVLVTLDGDGQHNPDEIPALIAPVLNDNADLVIGSRFLKSYENIPTYRKIGIDIISWLCNYRSNTRISDTQSCFRTYGRTAINSLQCEDYGYGFSVELLIKAQKNGLRLAEVPISCIYNSYSHKANPIVHGFNVAYATIKFRIIERV